MRSFFPTVLALLLVMGSIGHIFAAAFCPRGRGMACCLAKASARSHNSCAAHHDNTGRGIDGMTMGGMSTGRMASADPGLAGMVMDHAATQKEAIPLQEMSRMPSLPMAEDYTLAAREVIWARIEPPVETCAHCLNHSGVLHAPFSTLGLPVQSLKDLLPVPAPISGFPGRSPLTVTESGLPKEHAPPGGRLPRHVLIRVFLI